MPRTKPSRRENSVAPAPKTPPDTVDPIWLLKAIGATLIAALVCAWLTACYLVYQGEWQLVLHPSRTVDRTPATAGLSYTDVRFGAAETGQPRLTGWWIPAASTSGLQPKYAAFTVLYLHDGSGSLSSTVPSLERIHAAGLNVFAIDYRGFGGSDASSHPSDASMTEDTAAALEYLTSTGHVPATNVIPYGSGLGATLAVYLARAHPELPAVILEDPDPDPAATAAAAHPSHIIPVGLLFGDQFNIAKPLATLATPKLLVADNSRTSGSGLASTQTLFRRAASPKFTVTLPPQGDAAAYQTALGRFLDEYLPSR